MRKNRYLFAVLPTLALFGVALAACGRERAEAKARITPEYNKTTGRLQLLKYDADSDGTPDTFSYMDGARVVRIEIDKNEDGKIERWEYYDANQKLEKVGFSRANDGVEDAWSYLGPDGQLSRIEISTQRNGKVSRIERYQQGKLTSAEEDTDADGKIDKWETYEGERLASVAFDTAHRGAADRRLIYGADGTARLEVLDATGIRDSGFGIRGDSGFGIRGESARPANPKAQIPTNPESQIPTNPKSQIPNPE
jgi:hypothetical protein